MNRSVLLLVGAVMVISCGEPRSLGWKKYTAWLQEHPDACLREKEINEIRIQLRYIPADFSAYKELTSLDDDYTQHTFDSLRNLYACGLHFQLSLEADPARHKLLYENLEDQNDYRQRIETLSFYPQDFVSLETEGEEIFPVLSQYEGYNELSNKILVHVVFSPAWYACEKYGEANHKMAVVFKDPYWETGVNRFAFETSQLKSIPTLTL